MTRVMLFVIVAMLLAWAESAQPMRFGEHGPSIGGIQEYNGWDSITPESFFRNHVQSRVPAIFRGAASDWAITKRWTDSYLSRVYGNLSVLIEDKKDSRSVAPHDRKIEDFIAKYRQDNVQSRPVRIIQDGVAPLGTGGLAGSADGQRSSSLFLVSQTPDAMLHEVPLFPLLRCQVYTGDRVKGSPGRGRGLLVESNLWLSSGDTASTWHEDDDANINCLLQGTKHWFFVHPGHRAGVGMRDQGLSSAYSSVDVDNVLNAVDPDQALPDRHVPYRTVIARSGDCIFLPGRYPHHVRSYPGRNLALTTLFDVPSSWPNRSIQHDCNWNHTDESDHAWQAVLQSRNLTLSDAGLRWGYDGSGADGISMGLEDSTQVFSHLHQQAIDDHIMSNAGTGNNRQIVVLVESSILKALRSHLKQHLASADTGQTSLILDEPTLQRAAHQIFGLVAQSCAKAAQQTASIDNWTQHGIPATVVVSGSKCGCSEAAAVVKLVEATLQRHAELQTQGPGLDTEEDEDEEGWENEEDEDEEGWENEEDEDETDQEEAWANDDDDDDDIEAVWSWKEAQLAVESAMENAQDEEDEDEQHQHHSEHHQEQDDDETYDSETDAYGEDDYGEVEYDHVESLSADMLHGHGLPLGNHRPSEGSIAEVRDGESLSPADLWRQFLQYRRPVILRGAALSWPAMHKWSDERLSAEHGHLEVRLEEKKEREAEAGRVKGSVGLARSTIQGFLEAYKQPGFNGYVVSQLPDPMRRDLPIPRFLNCPAYQKRMMEFNLWISSGDTRSIIHRDPNNFANCLLAGSKNWTFIQPRYQHLVPMETEAEHESGGASPIDTRSVDLKAYPQFAKVRYERVLQHAGDCIISPGAYLHQVDSPPGRNMAVAFLFARIESLGSPSHVDTLIQECGEESISKTTNQSDPVSQHQHQHQHQHPQFRVLVDAHTDTVSLAEILAPSPSTRSFSTAGEDKTLGIASQTLWSSLPEPPQGDILNSSTRLMALVTAIGDRYRTAVGAATILPVVPPDLQVAWPFAGVGGLSLGTLDPRGLAMALARVIQTDCVVVQSSQNVTAEKSRSFWSGVPHPLCAWNTSQSTLNNNNNNNNDDDDDDMTPNATGQWCLAAPWLSRRSLRPDVDPLTLLTSPQCAVRAASDALGGVRPPPPALLWTSLAVGFLLASGDIHSISHEHAVALEPITAAVDEWTANFTAAQVASASGPISHAAANAVWPDLGYQVPQISRTNAARAIATAKIILKRGLYTVGDAVNAVTAIPYSYQRALGAAVSVDPSNTRFAEMAAISYKGIAALIQSAAATVRRTPSRLSGWVSCDTFAGVYAQVLGGTFNVGRQLAAVIDGDCAGAPLFAESCDARANSEGRLEHAIAQNGDGKLSAWELASHDRIQQALTPFRKWQQIKEFDHGRESSVTLRYLQGLVGTGPETEWIDSAT